MILDHRFSIEMSTPDLERSICAIGHTLIGNRWERISDDVATEFIETLIYDGDILNIMSHGSITIKLAQTGEVMGCLLDMRSTGLSFVRTEKPDMITEGFMSASPAQWRFIIQAGRRSKLQQFHEFCEDLLREFEIKWPALFNSDDLWPGLECGTDTRCTTAP